MKESIFSRSLMNTWKKMQKHSEGSIKHGLYLAFFLFQMIAIVAMVYYSIAGIVYSVCLFVPNSDTFPNAIAVNFLGKGFCLVFAYLWLVTLLVICEIAIFFYQLFKGTIVKLVNRSPDRQKKDDSHQS